MTSICIVPARGGSKRTPRKNIRIMCGAPAMAWPIGVAKASNLFDHIAVSTDDDEIALVAERCGALVIPRPAALANDTATTGEVMAHALQALEAQGITAATACCLYPTAVLVTTEDLHAGAERLSQGDVEYAFSVARYPMSPQRAFAIDPDTGRQHGYLIPRAHKSHYGARTQDEDVWHHDAGQWYFGQWVAWKTLMPPHGSWAAGVVIPRTRSVDIDTEEDLVLAEILLAKKEKAA